MSESRPEFSVIIGFKDWGLETLLLCLKAHMQSSIIGHIEVIVVDYGSKEEGLVKDAIEKVGAKVVRVNVEGKWSRSRALNFGIRAAKGNRVITTDSDILFGPELIETIQKIILESSEPEMLCTLSQCLDLPETLPLKRLSKLPWDKMHKTSTPRPRFGMGGCACFPRSFLEDIRGYDERLEWWGGEDNDLVYRAERHGMHVRWLEDFDSWKRTPTRRIFHIWHQKSFVTHKGNSEFFETWDKNRKITNARGTVYRNLHTWGGLPTEPPPVSVVIITHNRARLLKDAIISTLEQSFENFELLIIDDGSDDDTKEMVEKLDDPRIVYYLLKHGGIPTARNFGVKKARGEYICILDDDDLMLPNRIKLQFEALTDDSVGSYGGWIDFDKNKISYNPGKKRNLSTILFTGKVMVHGASMIKRETLLEFPYNKNYSYGSDFDLNLRLVDANKKLDYCESYILLRRMHGENVTLTNSKQQKNTGRFSAQERVALLSKEEETKMRNEAKQTQLFDIEKKPTLEELGHFFPSAFNPKTARIPFTTKWIKYKFDQGKNYISRILKKNKLLHWLKTNPNEINAQLKVLASSPFYIVIIGCGRSGTKFISQHLELGHEKRGVRGIVSWQSTIDDNISHIIRKDDFVLHQIRHPLSTISSVHTKILQDSWALIEANIPQIETDDSLLLKCMKYWYYWNQKAEGRAIISYKVEDIQSSVSKTTNTRRGWSSYRKINWEDMRTEDYNLTEKIRDLAAEYGYET